MMEVNLTTSYVSRQKNIPAKRFAHASAFCGSKILIVSGISNLMLDMGMRCVPMGETDCYSFDIYAKNWERLPDVPIGKLHPTLVTINNRYVFQIGGFDDYNFEIYRLDMRRTATGFYRPWKTLAVK